MAKRVSFGIILLIALVIVVAIYSVNQSAITHRLIRNSPDVSLQISTGEARARRFGLILDMRNAREREELGYYPNSIPVSFDQLSSEVPFLNSNRAVSILVYSNGDNRAKVAAHALYQMGYRNARYITTSYLALMPGSK
jgi:rhodanese-related sulfurtransferase